MSDFMKSIPITPDMVSLWVPSGLNRAQDLIRGNHGQCYGTHPNVPVLPNLINPSVGWHFDDVDDYIDFGNISAMNGISAFSFSAWINQSVLDARDIIFSKGDDVSNVVWFYTWDNGRFYFDIRSGATTNGSFDYSANVTAGEWFHLVVVYDGSGVANADKLKAFINAVEVTLAFSGNIPTTFPSTSGSVLIGEFSVAPAPFDGYIALPFIANKAWSVAQVKNFYNATKGMFAPRG